MGRGRPGRQMSQGRRPPESLNIRVRRRRVGKERCRGGSERSLLDLGVRKKTNTCEGSWNEHVAGMHEGRESQEGDGTRV